MIPHPLIHPRQYFYPLSEKKKFFSRLLTPTNVLAGKFELSPLTSISIWTSGKIQILTPTNVLAGKFELSSLTKFVTNAILLLVRKWSNFAISLPPKHK